MLHMHTKQQSARQLATIVFLASENHLKLEELYDYFDLYMDKLSDVCRILSPTTCGRFYSYAVKYLYQNCKCETLSEYMLNIFNSSCMNSFDCRVVDQIISICQEVEYKVLCTQLSYREETFIQLVINICNNCFFHDRVELLSPIIIIIGSLVMIVTFICVYYLYRAVINNFSKIVIIMTLYKIIFPSVMFIPSLSLTLIMITHFVDYIMLLIGSALKFDPLNPLVIQVVNKKLCVTVSTIIIWFLLFLCTRREYYKIQKEFKWTHVISCVITIGL